MDQRLGEAGISERELLQSFNSKLTQPSSHLSRSEEADKARITLQKRSLPSVRNGNLSLFLTRTLHSTYLKYKIYLHHLTMVTMTGMVVLMACAMRGGLLLFAHLAKKTFTFSFQKLGTSNSDSTIPDNHFHSNNTTKLEDTVNHETTLLPDYLQLPASYNLPDAFFYVAISAAISVVTFHLVCGTLQVYFYILRRDEPEEWKCQPHRFLTASNERHEIVCGTLNVMVAGGLSGVVTCWIVSNNYSTVYFKMNELGYPYLLFSAVWVFMWFETVAYYLHSAFHRPFLYKMVHKHHHRYHSPTAYSALSMSPIELVTYDSFFVLPLFLVPINGLVYVTVLAYVYYFGLMDHSGVKMESWFPWQPDTKFHDDHHRYFHCNFGFNLLLFDRLHGTLRAKDRIYGEETFGGKGKKNE